MSFIRTGFRELALKLKRQRTRIALRHDRRLLQKSEINLGREGTAQAANFPELRNEIVALKKLEQEQKEVALRIARIDEGIKRIEEERQQIARSRRTQLRNSKQRKSRSFKSATRRRAPRRCANENLPAWSGAFRRAKLPIAIF